MIINIIAAASLVLIAAPSYSGALIPGSYFAPLDQAKDDSALAFSSATPTQIPPAPPYGDQGYLVNAWGNCNCIGNPAINNNDTLRIVGFNPGTGQAQVNGLSVYMSAGEPTTLSAGQTTGVHIVGVANGSVSLWGFNSVLADSPFLAGYSGAGRYLDTEFDYNIGDPKTTMTGLSVGGILLNSPAYGSGFSLNFIGPGKLTEFAYSWDGASNIGLHLGLFTKPQAANAGSQPIQLDYTDSKNTKQNLTMTGFSGALVLQGTSGAAYATSAGAGITTTATISGCTLKISGGIIIGKSGNC